MNLLPQNYKNKIVRKYLIRKLIFLYAGVFIFLCAIGLVGIIVSKNLNDSLMESSKILKSEKYKTIIGTFKQYDDLQKELSFHQSILNRMKNASVASSKAIGYVAYLLPKDCLLIDITVDSELDIITIAGVSESKDIIDKYIQRLSKSSYMSDVKLMNISVATEKNVYFSIQISVSKAGEAYFGSLNE